MEAEKNAEKVQTPMIQKDPVDRLDHLANVMIQKAVCYGKSNVARHIVAWAQTIQVNVKGIKAGLKIIDTTIQSQEDQLNKLSVELEQIKKSRLWRIFRTLAGL